MRRLRAFLFFFFVFIVFAVGSATAQTFFSEAADNGEHRVVGAETTSDGRFVIAFQSDRSGVSPPDAFSAVVKLNDDGTVVWERRIAGDDPGGPVHAIGAAADGTLLVAGRVIGRRGDADVWFARLDEQGAILWQRAIGGPWDEFATAVQATSDGGAVVVGRAETRGPYGQDLLVLKTSPGGEIEWVRRIGSGDDESASDVREIDGGYFVVGSQDDIGLALRLGSAGQIEWARRSKTHGFRALALSGVDGGFAVVSHPNRLTRIGEGGEFVWQRQFLYVDSLFDVAESDSGFLLGGHNPFWWSAAVTDFGEVVWTREVVLPGPPYFGYVRSIVGLPGGGSFAVAEIRAPNLTWAMRLDGFGEYCNGFPAPTGSWSNEEIGVMTVVSLDSRSTSGLRQRETELRSELSSPIWKDGSTCH